MEAFKSTLDEVVGADLILHVVDASSREFEAQIAAVEDVLEQIHAQNISRVTVFNKIDLLDAEALAALRHRYEDAVFVSAETRKGLDDLIGRIAWVAASKDVIMHLAVPYSRGDIVSLAHERCRILSEDFREDGTYLTLQAPASCAGLLEAFSVSAEA